MDNNIVLQLESNVKPKSRLFFTAIRRSAKLIFAIIVPIILLPLLFYDSSKKFRCAYVLLLMALYWMVEPISLYATALIPVALFPLLQILSTDSVCAPYMKIKLLKSLIWKLLSIGTPDCHQLIQLGATNMMFVGGLLMAIAIENCNLHKRVALKVLLIIGTSVKRIMLGIMLVTAFLSMWISNTATTAMMVPIVDAMLDELDESPKGESKASNDDKEKSVFGKQRLIIRKALLLSIAYSANIGGTGTLTGTGTNLVLQGIFEELYPKSSDLTFSRWFIYAAPGMVICVMAAWLFLYFMFIRKNNSVLDESKDKIRTLIQQKYTEMGPLTFKEKGVIAHFLLIVLLWFFRKPEIFKGWTDLITDDNSIKDATPAILIAISMFIFPANLSQFYKEKHTKRVEKLLDWPTVQKKMPWGVILLLGGGFALADGVNKSGLSEWLGQRLAHFDHLSPRVAMIALTVVGALITEVASNVATASVILPVVDRVAQSMKVNPLLLMMPTTIGISFAFMFPVATPPNAIVFESLGLNTFEMIKPGIVMNILCIGIELALINSWGQLVFDLNDFPDWAQHSNTTIS